MKKLIALALIIIAAIGLFNDIESLTAKSSSSDHKSSRDSIIYSSSDSGYSYSGSSSYSYTCYKCLNKGYHTCSICSGKGYKKEYISVPNYSGTGSSPSTVIEKDCTNCDDGIQDCKHCYN